MPPGRGSAAGRKFLAPPYYSQRVVFAFHLSAFFITLRAKLSGAVYCNRSCLFVAGCVGVCMWVCYHDNSKLRASILTKLGLQVKVVTISS